jgi:hypothetical protein
MFKLNDIFNQRINIVLDDILYIYLQRVSLVEQELPIAPWDQIRILVRFALHNL